MKKNPFSRFRRQHQVETVQTLEIENPPASNFEYAPQRFQNSDSLQKRYGFHSLFVALTIQLLSPMKIKSIKHPRRTLNVQHPAMNQKTESVRPVP